MPKKRVSVFHGMLFSYLLVGLVAGLAIGLWQGHRVVSITAILIFAYFLAIFVSRKLLLPLNKISDYLGEVAEGNFLNRINFRSWKEIEALTCGFNRMAEKLNRRFILREELAKEAEERKRLESAFLENEALNRALFEYSGDGILLIYKDMIVDCNGRSLEMLGCRRQDLIARPLYSFSPLIQPDGCSSEGKARRMLEEAFLGRRQSFEWVYDRPDGQTLYVELALNRVEAGNKAMVQVILRDITRRKLCEEKMRKISLLQAEMLKPGSIKEKTAVVAQEVSKMFKAQLCCIWIAGPADICERGCAYASAKEGCPCSSRRQCLHLAASAGDHEDAVQEWARRLPLESSRIGAVATGHQRGFFSNDPAGWPLPGAVEWASGLGIESCAACQLCPCEDNLAGALAIFCRSEISAEDYRLIEGLSNTVALMVQSARAQESVINYACRIQAVNRELDDFTYIVSHDLKEPLRSINAFSKFLEDDYGPAFDENARRYIQRIKANTDHMHALIEDLLEISRIERKLNPMEEADIGAIIDEARRRLEYSIQEKNVVVDIKGDLPRIYCDRTRITEVFANLFSNAIKFNDKPEPRIEVGYSLEGAYHQFYVRDNGPGIEEQYFEKIFSIFQRLVKKEDYEGTGAGLTIVKKIIGMHRGRVWVESRPGEFSAFYFTIPAAKEAIYARKKLGEILLDKKMVTETQLNLALEEQAGL